MTDHDDDQDWLALPTVTDAVPVAPTTGRWEVDDDDGRPYYRENGERIALVGYVRHPYDGSAEDALVALVRERDRVTVTPEPSAAAIDRWLYTHGRTDNPNARWLIADVLAARAALVAEAREDDTDG